MRKVKSKRELVITTVRVPRVFWGKVRARAFEEGLGTGELIIRALSEYLRKGGH
jgi:hypothetical protein